MNIKHLLIIFTFLLISCEASVLNTGIDLGNGYSLNSQGRLNWISEGSNIFSDEISAHISQFKYDDNYIVALQNPSKAYYSERFTSVLAIRFNILLYPEQKSEEIDNDQKRFMKSNWWSDVELRKKIAQYIDKENNNDILKINAIVDSVVSHNPTYQKLFANKANYWIIKKKEHQTFGPYTSDEFLLKMKELGVPDDLMFDN
jgi:hypothetical protein